MLCTGVYGVAIFSAVHGWGHLSTYVTPGDRITAFKGLFIMQILWILAVALIRISLSFSLLRISTNRTWRWTLWALMSIQTITYIGHMMFVLAGCRPIRANWEPVMDVRCWNHRYVLVFGWVANSEFDARVVNLIANKTKAFSL